ncbi:MAG: hypothetical protein FH756_10510 [Firmicutes bacterium]|nr:hypothetical protein [Bacillota bacterium]
MTGSRRRLVGLIYVLFFLFTTATIVREFADIFTTNFMLETPLLVFSIGIVIASAYAVRNGLEVFTRVNEIILPLILVMIALLVIFI